jgi:hypothetical protein
MISEAVRRHLHPSCGGNGRCEVMVNVEAVDIVVMCLYQAGCHKGACAGCKWTPGLFCVFCACARRKMLGFYLMDQHESAATMMQIIYTRFPRAPKLIMYAQHVSQVLMFVWLVGSARKMMYCVSMIHRYDNGCNADRYCNYRVPWFFRYVNVT